MIIKITEHAKQRANDRLGIAMDEIENYLIKAISKAEEVFHSGQGRAWEYREDGVVLITDVNKSSIVTVYHSKGTEVKQCNKEMAALANKKGEIFDEEVRSSILKTFDKRWRHLEIKRLDLNILESKLKLKLSNTKKRTLKSKKEEQKDELKLILGEVIEKLKVLRFEINDVTSKKDTLINQTEKVLGYDLNEYRKFL